VKHSVSLIESIKGVKDGQFGHNMYLLLIKLGFSARGMCGKLLTLSNQVMYFHLTKILLTFKHFFVSRNLRRFKKPEKFGKKKKNLA
jgi:hypothetical protein